MAIFLPYPDSFTCAICGNGCGQCEGQTWLRWSEPRRRDLPPICWYCEQEWGIGPYGIDVKLDNRLARQISALAEALGAEAFNRAGRHGVPYAGT